MLGINTSNGRSSLRPPTTNYAGPEWYVTLDDHGNRVTDGRARDPAAAALAVALWTSGASQSVVESEAPFVGERRRIAELFAADLDPTLRTEIGRDPAYELWVHGEGRYCKVIHGCCTFFLGDAQVALKTALTDAHAAVHAWLLRGVTPGELAAFGVEVEEDADVLLRDPAAWHWIHARRRAANPDDALASLAPVLLALADSPIVSRFYTFSSLNRLCFSASSHFPWVGEFPLVAPTGEEGRYWVANERIDPEDGPRWLAREMCSLALTVGRIEAALSVSPIQPFFGSAVDLESARLSEVLAELGQPVRPVRRGGWPRPEITIGDRTCHFEYSELRCFHNGQERRFSGTIEKRIQLARAFLGAELDIDNLP
jgi:hypothetical protein